MEDDGPAALITMLGFQEGNDDPFVVNQWLRDIARPGDYLLSESQLYADRHIENIPAFFTRTPPCSAFRASPLNRRWTAVHRRSTGSFSCP
ncbi:hypothetical protein QW131_24080 [Roseibium salinum]|nr:hypothetical protein [Roseibium salinum]